MLDGKMHQTTLRLSPDLWQALEQECKRLGVSAAQYLREAAVARLAFTAGRRGSAEYEVALARAASLAPAGRPQTAVTPLGEATGDRLQDSMAVTAQSAMARLHARQIRETTERLREARQAARQMRDV